MKYKICDIHSHIAPNVDDGATDIDMSINMIREAHKQGVSAIVLTSHSGYNSEMYNDGINAIRSRIRKENIPVTVHSGCEIYCTNSNVQRIINALDEKRMNTINNTQYVLIEFDPYVRTNDISKCVEALVTHGYHPIIAHIERYYTIHHDISFIQELKNKGCLFQVNAYSLMGETERSIKEFARKLLATYMISFIGSDAHRTNHRPYAIENGVQYIYQHCNKTYADNICYKNAEQILGVK